jgi:hypothetical protein
MALPTAVTSGYGPHKPRQPGMGTSRRRSPQASAIDPSGSRGFADPGSARTGWPHDAGIASPGTGARPRPRMDSFGAKVNGVVHNHVFAPASVLARLSA